MTDSFTQKLYKDNKKRIKLRWHNPCCERIVFLIHSSCKEIVCSRLWIIHQTKWNFILEWIIRIFFEEKLVKHLSVHGLGKCLCCGSVWILFCKHWCFFSINWSSFFALCLDMAGLHFCLQRILSLSAIVQNSNFKFRLISIFVAIAAGELKQDYLVSEWNYCSFQGKIFNSMEGRSQYVKKTIRRL